MNIKYLSRACALVILVVLFINNITAQSKEAVILINSIAYNVVISPNGEIEEVKGEARNHMRGYIKSQEEFPLSPSIIADAKEMEEGELAPGSTVSRERQFFTFESGYATMDEQLTTALEKVISEYSSGETLLLTAHKAVASENDALSKNRIETIKTFLELKGIPANRITSEIVVSSPLANKIAVSYVQ